jgi:hypothetical protein
MNKEPTKAKLCRDCVHSRAGEFQMLCAHPRVEPQCLATGELEWADFVRKFGPCGIAARLFELRPSEPKAVQFTRWQRLQWRIWRWVRGIS